MIRLFILSTHYRKPINFSFENMEDSKKALQNITSSMKRYEELILKFEKEIDNIKIKKDIKEISEFYDKLEKYDKKFIDAMEEDMNTPQALATIFDQIRETNKFYDVILGKLSEENIKGLKYSHDNLENKIENILGILLVKEDVEESNKITKKLIEFLLELRNEARKERNFKLSDDIRDKLKEFGVEIKDNKDSTTSYTIII